MNFSELEQLMSSRGVNTLAEIARALNTTPQAVSNWKARDKVPYHLVIKLNKASNNPNKNDKGQVSHNLPLQQNNDYKLTSLEKTFSISDILLILAENVKIIFLAIFISIFVAFTNTQFIQEKLYESYAKVLFSSKTNSPSSGLAGLASQFGVEIPSGAQADLSSPTFFPELIKSRTFAEKILEKSFYTKKYEEELTLLAILTYGKTEPKKNKDALITSALKSLNGMINYETSAGFNIIKITAFEPLLAKELAEAVIIELQELNKFYKNQSVREKITFIENRINSVNKDLELSEKNLKDFKEKNRQTNSPALQLEEDRLNREAEVQKGIFLTLKQQLELAKIEAVQQNSIVHILDPPQVAFLPSNKNLRQSITLGLLIGMGLGIFFAFLRNYINNDDIHERKKIRRVKLYFKKKSKEILLDYRMTAIISIMLIAFLPIYLGYKSNNPTIFGMYSKKIFILNVVYISVLISTAYLFFVTRNKK